MHTVIFGSLSSGKFTINTDGTRVQISRTPEGWKISNAASLATVQKTVQAEAGELLSLLMGQVSGLKVQ
jgi:hypothetical protein